MTRPVAPRLDMQGREPPRGPCTELAGPAGVGAATQTSPRPPCALEAAAPWLGMGDANGWHIGMGSRVEVAQAGGVHGGALA